MSEQRCLSPICTVTEGVRGKLFTPPDDATGVYKIWCPACIRVSAQMNFYASETANMVRNVYATYIDTELPKNVKLILEQFAREIVQQLGEEL